MTIVSTSAEPTVRSPVVPQRSSNRQERARDTHDLLRRAHETDDEVVRDQLLGDVCVLNMDVARAVVSRYRNRGVAEEDLQQVAYLALVKASRGYDHTRGIDFLGYAVPTMRGDVKKYFRDHGWMIRPPRRIQELQFEIAGAERDLSQAHGTVPTPSEVAARLGVPDEHVSEAMSAQGCFHPTSLDRPVDPSRDVSLGELLGGEDVSTHAAEARVVLSRVVRRLSTRDQRVLLLRFFHDWKQSEIAADLGVSQVEVSRLLSRIMRNLRDGLSENPLGDVS